MTADEVRTSKAPTKFAAQVETYSKASTALVLVVYVTGYLIVSLHDAKYGITQFNLVRAKVFAAGFVFVLLVTLPAAAMNYGFSQLGVLDTLFEPREARIEPYRKLILLFGFCFTASLISGSLAFLFVSEAEPHPWWYAMGALVALIIFLLCFNVSAKALELTPKRAALLAGLATVLLLSTEFWLGERPGLVTMWCFAVGVNAYTLKASRNHIKEMVDWRNWIGWSLLIGLYAGQLYPRMEPKYGGGSPLPVLISRSSDTKLRHESVRLIDENDYGFYLLKSGETKATFVPRSAINEIFYGDFGDKKAQD